MKIVNDWAARWAKADPNRVLATEPLKGNVLTWGQADDRASRIARWLAREGQVGVADRVAVLADNRVETIEAFFAVARLRATLVPLNTKLSPAELAQVFVDAEPKVLLVAGNLIARAPELIAALAQARPRARTPLVVALDGAGWGTASYEDLITGPADGVPAEAVVDEEDPWLVLYTSGSTGKAKGALVTHRQIVWNAMHTMIACDLGRDDATITYTPMFYTGGWNVLSTPHWYRGAKVHVLPTFQAETILELVQREKITTLFGVPTTLGAMRESVAWKTTDLSSLRVVLVGGAACPPALIEAYGERGIALRQGYGLTEVGPNCFGVRPEDALRKCGSIGRPNLHLEVKVTDELGNAVKQGDEGELRLRGPIAFGGYLNNEQATREAFDADGFFRTGDIVKQDSEGQFWIVGRKNDMFKSGGEKVYAGEVEAAIAQHESVAEVVVFGVPDERWGEVGRAIVVPRAGAGLDADALKTWLSSRLAKFKLPKSFVFTTSLPRTETGKIARASVKAKWKLDSQPAVAGK